MMDAVRALLENSTLRSFVISVLMAVGGWAANSLLQSNKNAEVLNAHTSQIEKLWTSQKETHDAVQDVQITNARIEGKIDVLNTKIDDDRLHGGSAPHR